MEINILILVIINLIIIYKIVKYKCTYQMVKAKCIGQEFLVTLNKTTFEYIFNDINYVTTISFSSFKEPEEGKQYYIYVKKDEPNVIKSSWTFNAYIFGFIVFMLILIKELIDLILY